MTRVKSGTGTRRRHKKILKLAKGYWMTRHKQFKKAQEAVLHAGEYSYGGRKDRKRAFRQLWIVRLNAALRTFGMTYSQFAHSVSMKKVAVDRKIFAALAVDYPTIFRKMIEKIK